MYRKILVAYNGTPESRSALDEVVQFMAGLAYMTKIQKPR